jgi:hypothetical protein
MTLSSVVEYRLVPQAAEKRAEAPSEALRDVGTLRSLHKRLWAQEIVGSLT